MDIAKAYNSVEFWAMRQTLEAYGLHKDDIDMMMEMMIGNKTQLQTAYGLTEEICIEAGLRQGDNISPPLYLLFINPLIKWLEKKQKPI